MRDALEAIDRGAMGITLVVDTHNVLTGILTDGDVRRRLLKGAQMTDNVVQHMNRQFTAGSTRLSRQENTALLSEVIRHLPIVDEAGHPVDMLSWAEFWRIPVMEPSLGGNELKYISDCITSNWISSRGEYVTRFEQQFAEYIGVKYALSASSGTTALHLALLGLDIGPGDEVIVPDLTFGASANVVYHCGATPVFVDVDRETWTIDVADVAANITPRTKAIMPVHIYGHPADMQPVLDVANRHGLYVVEDCAEAMGAEYRGQRVGGIGDVGMFSFFANKIITTGEGGMVTTNNPDIYEKMSVLRSHGMQDGKRYWHLYPGYNYRMTNLQAAIGLAQLERVDDFLSYRKKVVARYNEQLDGLPGITRPPEAAWAKSVYWLYSILVDEDAAGISRDELIDRLAERNIETRQFFYPLHVQPAYREQAGGGDFPTSTLLAERGMNLPTANNIKLEDVDRVCASIQHALKEAQLSQA